MKLPVEEFEEDMEFYGPIDGVLPSQHPHVYRPLMQMYCVIKSIIRVYTWEMLRFCTNCYDTMYEPVKQHLVEGGWHSMCKPTALMMASSCHQCGISLATVTPACRCTECIEEYLELTPGKWNVLNMGGIIDVITRW